MAPLYGTLDTAPWAETAPRLETQTPEPLALKGVRVLECRTELDDDVAGTLVPPSLHPSIPSYGSISFTLAAESPWGPFGLAELRIAARLGGRAVLMLLNGICDNPAAAAGLAARFGYRIETGAVTLQDLHYKAVGRASLGGRSVLELGMSHRDMLPGTRLSLLPTLNLARLPDGKVRFIGVVREVSWTKTEGGTRHIDVLDDAAFRAAGRFRPMGPMSIALATGEMLFKLDDFTVDPVRPAEESLETIGG